MNKNSSLHAQEDEYQNHKEKLIQEWVRNGARRVDAEQLYNDIETDSAHADPDRDTYDDPTIDERLEKYSSKRQK